MLFQPMLKSTVSRYWLYVLIKRLHWQDMGTWRSKAVDPAGWRVAPGGTRFAASPVHGALLESTAALGGEEGGLPMPRVQ